MKPRVEPIARKNRRPPPARRETARAFVVVPLSIMAAGVGSCLAALAAWAVGLGRDEMRIAALIVGFVCLFWTAAYLSFRGL